MLRLSCCILGSVGNISRKDDAVSRTRISDENGQIVAIEGGLSLLTLHRSGYVMLRSLDVLKLMQHTISDLTKNCGRDGSIKLTSCFCFWINA